MRVLAFAPTTPPARASTSPPRSGDERQNSTQKGETMVNAGGRRVTRDAGDRL